jgi:hypothetical protein
MTTAQYFAERNAVLREGVRGLLRPGFALTASQLRVQLNAGMRELDRVLQQMRVAGEIRSRRQRWELVP